MTSWCWANALGGIISVTLCKSLWSSFIYSAKVPKEYLNTKEFLKYFFVTHFFFFFLDKQLKIDWKNSVLVFIQWEGECLFTMTPFSCPAWRQLFWGWITCGCLAVDFPGLKVGHTSLFFLFMTVWWRWLWNLTECYYSWARRLTVIFSCRFLSQSGLIK
jgi:hypothetical protein